MQEIAQVEPDDSADQRPAETAPAPPPTESTPAPRPAESAPAVRFAVDASLNERWPGLVDGIRGRKRLLGLALGHARPLALTEGELSLGFPKGGHAAQQVTEEKAALEAIVGELLKSPTRVRIVELQAGEGAEIASLAETSDRVEREARDARLRAGRENPAVLRAASLLGAEIEDVRDLGGGTAS